MPRIDSPAWTRSSAHASRCSCLVGVVGDLLGQRRREMTHALAVADDDVAGHHQHPGAGDRHVDVERDVGGPQRRALAER